MQAAFVGIYASQLITANAEPLLQRHLRRILDHRGLQTLGVLHVHRLDVAVQLLLRTLLVVTLPRYPDPQAERNALHTGLPDFLVQLRVEADVAGALYSTERLAIGQERQGR